MNKLFLVLLFLTSCTTSGQRYEGMQASTVKASNQVGQIRNGAQRCLTFSAGQPVYLESCNGTTAQQWVYEPQTAILRNLVSGLCLDVVAQVATEGGFLTGKPCQHLVSQQWFFDQKNLYNSTGWCIDELKEPTQTLACLAACSQRPTQQFQLVPLIQSVVPYAPLQSPPPTPVQSLIIQKNNTLPFFYSYPCHPICPPPPFFPPPPPRPALPEKPPVSEITPVIPPPVDKNRNGRYDREDIGRHDALKRRVLPK